jgi:aromatic-L-amino-acid/L-tryptophan decarboxylase
VGAAGYRTMIADDLRLARDMADAVRRHPELALLTQSLSITTFRFVPADLSAAVETPAVEAYLNTLNEKLLDTVQRRGRVFVSNAVIAGKYALRACIVNFHTGPADVAAIPDIIVEVGRELDAALRPGAANASTTP